MSLFGTSPEAGSRPQAKSSLFDDEDTTTTSRARTQGGGGSGLFADEDASGGNDADADAPWGFISPRKAAGRGNIVKTLLPASTVPEFYIDTFDMLLESGGSAGAGVSMEAVRRVLAASGRGQAQCESILKIVEPTGKADGLGRGEFNVLLALIGLAQEGEEVNLDGVDERRRRLPTPSLPNLKPANRTEAAPAAAATGSTPRPTKQAEQASSTQAYNFPDSDPWSASAKPDGTANSTQARSNGMSSHTEDSSTARTTSSYTATEYQESSNRSKMSSDTAPTTSNNSWGIYEGAPGGGFDGGDLHGGGFSDESIGGAGTQRLPKAGGGSRAPQGVEEVVTVLALPEKEGMFLFQYRNYEVASARRNSKVVRRYSDFVWLLDCLHKKYPFRQLPLLPPKRVAINGNHIATDALFIEKRRRGLVRFVNACARHPILSQDQLVVMFLTVPTELSVLRKQATVSLAEEFTGKPLPPTLEESLPANLNDVFETVRSGVRRSTETYISLCTLLERLLKRREGVCADYARLSLALTAVADTSADTYALDTDDVPALDAGLAAAARQADAHARLLEDEARDWDAGVLEDLKRQRDALASLRDVFDRRDRLARDNIPQLERRIAANEGKLAQARAKPEGTRKAGEAEKLEDAIMKDKESIIAQHARGVFIRECVRDEIRTFAASQAHVGRLHAGWAQGRARAAELQLDAWRGLAEQLEGMPGGDV